VSVQIIRQWYGNEEIFSIVENDTREKMLGKKSIIQIIKGIQNENI